MKRFLFLLLLPMTAWGQAFQSGYHPAFGAFISSPSQPDLRILERPESGKGVLDIRHSFIGLGGPGTSLIRLQGKTVPGQLGSVSGIVTRLVHDGGSDIGDGFNIGYSCLNNAKDWTPPDSKSAALQCFFGNAISPLHTDQWQIATMELNATNIRGDKGERLKAADFDPGRLKGGGISRIVVLKPESRYGSFTDKGYPIDMYLVAGPDNHDSTLVGGYGGIVFKNDAIMDGGIGIRLGGRTDVFPNAPPDSAIRIDKQWERGLDFRGAEFTDSHGAIDLSGKHRIRWDTPAGSLILFAGENGSLYAYGHEGLKRLYP